MEIVRWPDAGRFMRRAGPFLTADQARHNLTLGIALTLRDPPSGLVLPTPPLFATVERDREIVATAIRQSPYGLVVSPAAGLDIEVDLAWLATLAELVRGKHPDLPSVQAPPRLAWTFAEAWQRLGGGSGRLEVSLRLHALDALLPTPPVPGQLRRATPADLDLVLSWMQAMHDEALPFEPPIDADRLVAVRLADPGDPLRALYLWETPDGVPRSVCGATRPTPGGIGINAVYTPPEHRRRGYATAAVAELSRRLLATGRRCVLYTDLSNPTSNRLYAAIGYRPVCDVVNIGFRGGGAGRGNAGGNR